jgi:hypothetical protein
MLQLNLPTYSFKIKKEKEKQFIFDKIRKKYVFLTPEEWVRQHFIEFLISEKKYPQSFIANEVSITYNGLKKRCDSLVYNKEGKIKLIVEFKAPHIHITQETFDQIAVYNMKLKVDFLIVSNGLEHFCCRIDYQNMKYDFLQEIPKYEEICE